MTKPLSIIVDIDEPLYPFIETAHAVSIAAGLCPEGTPVPTAWDPYDGYGCTAEQWWEALAAATHTGVLYRADPQPGAVDALWRLEAAGHFIHLVTARGTNPSLGDAQSELIKYRTREWLRRHFVPFDTLTFSKDKTVVPADVAIDDHPRNCHDLHNAGVDTYILDMPYNRDYPAKRVPSMAAFANLILLDERKATTA